MLSAVPRRGPLTAVVLAGVATVLPDDLGLFSFYSKGASMIRATTSLALTPQLHPRPSWQKPRRIDFPSVLRTPRLLMCQWGGLVESIRQRFDVESGCVPSARF
jgi:hypothetical protein